MSARAHNFQVVRRDYGHWDIYIKKCRIFCIRGDTGNYFIRDERIIESKIETITFKTIASCMSYICAELMFEPASNQKEN